MPRSLRPASAVALAISLMLTLSSCGDDPPKPKPSDPSDTPTSSSPTATEPPKPATPEQVIRDFIEAQDEMYSNGKSEEFLALSHTCKYCDGQADLIGGIYRKGGYIRRGEIKIRSIELQRDMSSKVFKVFNVVYDVPATTFRRSKSSKVEHDTAEKGTTDRYRLVKRPDGWKIRDVTLFTDEV